MFDTYDVQEASERTGLERHKFKVLFEEGMLLGIKTGQGRRYSDKELDEFWETFKGSDLSNEENIRMTAAMWRMKKADH